MVHGDVHSHLSRSLWSLSIHCQAQGFAAVFGMGQAKLRSFPGTAVQYITVGNKASWF